MSKKTIAIILVGVISLGLIGCGDSFKEGVKDGIEDTAKEDDTKKDEDEKKNEEKTQAKVENKASLDTIKENAKKAVEKANKECKEKNSAYTDNIINSVKEEKANSTIADEVLKYLISEYNSNKLQNENSGEYLYMARFCERKISNKDKKDLAFDMMQIARDYTRNTLEKNFKESNENQIEKWIKKLAK